MCQNHLKWRIVLSVLLIGLVLGEVVPVFHQTIYGSFDPNYLLKDKLIDTGVGVLIEFVGPLLVVLAGVLYSEKLIQVSLVALVAIFTGFMVIYALWVGDVSGGIMKLLSVLVYWLTAFLALVLIACGSKDKQSGKQS